MTAHSERRAKLLAWIKTLKPPFNCKGCGGFHPATLEFHFSENRKKDYSVLDALQRAYSIKKVQKDIDECRILCANCHKKLHWNDDNGV